MGAAGVVDPAGTADELLGVEVPNILPPGVPGNNPPACVVAGLSPLAGVNDSSFFFPKVKPPPPKVAPAPAAPNKFPVEPAELVLGAPWPNCPPVGVPPVLAFAPKRLGVDAPDPGFDPAFIPKLGPPPALPEPNGLAPVVAPPKRPPPDAGFDVAGVGWPKTEDVAGVPLVPNRPP